MTEHGEFLHPMSSCAISFDKLRKVRITERYLLTLELILNSFLDVSPDLEEISSFFGEAGEKNDESSAAVREALNDLREEIQSCKDKALYLQKICQSIAQSFLDSVRFEKRLTAQNMSRNWCVAATSAREDAVTNQAIALVASLYLAISFCSGMSVPGTTAGTESDILQSIFGMDLVSFDNESHNLLVSLHFWPIKTSQYRDNDISGS